MTRIIARACAALALLAVAASACERGPAWVLWSNSSWQGGPDVWRVTDSFDKRADCVKSIDATQATIERVRSKTPPEGFVSRNNDTWLVSLGPKSPSGNMAWDEVSLSSRRRGPARAEGEVK